jgi:hypothetical protein
MPTEPMEQKMDERIAALEGRLERLERDNARLGEQLAATGYVLHAFMAAVTFDLSAKAQDPPRWAREFMSDLHDWVEDGPVVQLHPRDWPPIERVHDQVLAQLDWLSGGLGRTIDFY